MTLRPLHDTLNFLGRRRQGGVRWDDDPIGQLLTLGARLPAIVGGHWQSQIGEDRRQTAVGTELLCAPNGCQDVRLFVRRMSPTRRYRQCPFLSCRFSALSSAMTACRRCTSASNCSSAGRTFLRPRA